MVRGGEPFGELSDRACCDFVATHSKSGSSVLCLGLGVASSRISMAESAPEEGASTKPL